MVLSRTRLIRSAAPIAILLSGGCLATRRECQEPFNAQLADALRDHVVTGVALDYEWTGGYGPGDVRLHVAGDGESTLALEEHGGEPKQYHVSIPQDRLLTLLAVVEHSNFACAQPRPRKTCVTDIGRTRIGVRVGTQAHEVYWDEMNYLDGNERVFEELVPALYKLSDVFGVEFDWGPFGSTAMPCDLLRGEDAR